MADITRLCQEILDRCGLSATQVAGQFHTSAFDPRAEPRAQMDQLLWLTKCWLQPDTWSPIVVVEQEAMEKFLKGLPDDVRRAVGLAKGSSFHNLTATLENVLATKEMGTAEVRIFRPRRLDLRKEPECRSARSSAPRPADEHMPWLVGCGVHLEAPINHDQWMENPNAPFWTQAAQ